MHVTEVASLIFISQVISVSILVDNKFPPNVACVHGTGGTKEGMAEGEKTSSRTLASWYRLTSLG